MPAEKDPVSAPTVPDDIQRWTAGREVAIGFTLMDTLIRCPHSLSHETSLEEKTRLFALVALAMASALTRRSFAVTAEPLGIAPLHNRINPREKT